MTPRDKTLKFISDALCLEPAAIEFVLELAAEDARTSWPAAWNANNALSLDQWLQLARQRQLLDLFKQAVRYDRRHQAKRLDDLIDEPAAKTPEPATTLRVDEFFEALDNFERMIVAMKSNGYTNRAIEAQLHLDHRTVETYLASVAAKAVRCLGT